MSYNLNVYRSNGKRGNLRSFSHELSKVADAVAVDATSQGRLPSIVEEHIERLT